ncbi:MAG: hypothetical protein Q9167_000244 [Letrouitia subvulpina]
MAAESQADALDDLFDFDVFQNVNTNEHAPDKEQLASTAKDREATAGLGIDEEIKVARRRRPVAKLDEDRYLNSSRKIVANDESLMDCRLLSSAGIPKLRRIAREKFKFRGKGHEFSDIAQMLNIYQLWLDDLYPRAKFADGLTILEGLGHKKRIQIMRREWINEGKAQNAVGPDPVPLDNSPSQHRERNQPADGFHAEYAEAGERLNHSSPLAASREQSSGVIGLDGHEEGPPEQEASADTLFLPAANDQPLDELDALLAEDEAVHAALASDGRASPKEPLNDEPQNNFDDEMEAMAEIDDMW